MPTVVLYPFFSQQDKATDKFLLHSDSGVKMYAYMARCLQQAGWNAVLVLPKHEQCAEHYDLCVQIERIPYKLAVSNLDRRLQWEPGWLRWLSHSDLFLTQHEFLAYPMRCIAPNLKIVSEAAVDPNAAWPQTKSLFQLAWDASTALHCTSSVHARRTKHTQTFVWAFAHSVQQQAQYGDCDIDVLFNARGSSTGYSNHKAFVRAFQGSSLRIRMTDPTGYLREAEEAPAHWLPREQYTEEQYHDLLKRTAVVVGLTDNGYGGHAFREAIAVGRACPVALKVPGYEELLGPDWPFYCTLDNIAEVVAKAKWIDVPFSVGGAVMDRVMQCSYANAWRRAERDINLLMEA